MKPTKKYDISKIIALLLALTMMLAVVVGCADNADDVNKETQSDETFAEESETEEEKIPLGLPDLTFEGETIRFITKSNGSFAALDVGIEEQNGDVYNDAIWARDLLVEETYDCSIECVFSKNNSPVADAKKLIQAQDDYYDVIYDGLGMIFGIAQEKMIVDMNSLSYFDFTKPWWDAKVNNDLSVHNKLYATYGEHMIGPKSGLYCLFFNKKLISDLNLNEPYDLVRSGNWTMDEFVNMAKIGNEDLNGDGKMTGEDRFGHLTEGYSAYTFMISCNWKCGVKGEDDSVAICDFDDAFYAKAEKVSEVLSDEDITNYCDKVPGVTDPWGAFWTGAFINNQFLFREGAMHDCPALRDMDSDFGIVPIPKFDEKQENFYATNSVPNAQMMGIPVSTSKADDVSFILEAMAYYSVEMLTPVYYNKVLQGKSFRDDDSEEMLDIIFGSKVFDVGYALDIGGIISVIRESILKNDGKLASTIGKKQKAINNSLEKIAKKFADE